MFGGNSNWRGPIWFPINLLLMQSLLAYDSFFGDTFKVEYPVGSGETKRLYDVVTDLGDRMCSIFVRGEDGRRVVFGDNDYFQNDPHWRDLVPFYEYFDGDDGTAWGQPPDRLDRHRGDHAAARRQPPAAGLVVADVVPGRSELGGSCAHRRGLLASSNHSAGSVSAEPAVASAAVAAKASRTCRQERVGATGQVDEDGRIPRQLGDRVGDGRRRRAAARDTGTDAVVRLGRGALQADQQPGIVPAVPTSASVVRRAPSPPSRLPR